MDGIWCHKRRPLLGSGIGGSLWSRRPRRYSLASASLSKDRHGLVWAALLSLSLAPDTELGAPTSARNSATPRSAAPLDQPADGTTGPNPMVRRSRPPDPTRPRRPTRSTRPTKRAGGRSWQMRERGKAMASRVEECRASWHGPAELAKGHPKRSPQLLKAKPRLKCPKRLDRRRRTRNQRPEIRPDGSTRTAARPNRSP